jgi:hypothetical protein
MPMKEKTRRERRFRFSSRFLVRCGVAVVFIVGVLWLATWLAQRSYMSQNKRHAMQSWLDEKLNADVGLLADIAVRINLLRRSRISLPIIEVEHPNPLFSSKFARVSGLSAYAPPWSVFHLWPGKLTVVAERMRLIFEENESGEWSSEGLMNPLAAGDSSFPFPVPRIKEWEARIADGTLLVRRRRYEAAVALSGTLSGTRDSDRVSLNVERLPFTFGMAGADEKAEGVLGPATIVAHPGAAPGESPRFVPGYCGGAFENIPARMVSFLFPGIPLDTVGGAVSGFVRLAESSEAEGKVIVEGELHDVPLAVFGLPRQSLVRVDWPVGPMKAGLSATIRLGPPGFGAFAINMKLDGEGRPQSMTMQGDVASLDDMPAIFTSYSRWPDWVSRTFSSVEWRAGRWLGFGWSGTDMHLRLIRTVAGLNLTGEAGLMGGRVRIAMSPDQPGSPVIVAAERLDASQLVQKLSQWIPGGFPLRMSGGSANMSWRGVLDSAGGVDEWGVGLVFAQPVLDTAASGAWWRGLAGIPNAVVGALPEWGGGDAASLRALSEKASIPVEQLSVVMEKGGDGAMFVEFRVYGDVTGQATGLVEVYPDGMVEGEIHIAGDSALIDATMEANPLLGHALRTIAGETQGLRVLFSVAEDGNVVFSFPFLDDARRLRAALDGDGGLEP